MTTTLAAQPTSATARTRTTATSGLPGHRIPDPPEPPDPAADSSGPPGHALGRRGEAVAARYLETLGLVVLARNWRCRDGELDIIATDGRRLVVAEVKTRTNDDFGSPVEAITPVKIRRIRAATHAWLREVGIPWVEVSYDVIAIWWPKQGSPRLQHRRGAF